MRRNSLVSAFLYRLCRELVTNAIKHAEASSIKVTLSEDDQQFNIQVTDNGVGMSSKHFRSDASDTTVIVVLPKGEDNGETNDTDR